MPLVYDNTRTAKNGGGWINRDDLQSWVTQELPQNRATAKAALERSQGRWKTADKFAYAAAAVPFAAAAAPLVMGGSAAASGGAGMVNGLAITPYAGTASMSAPALAGGSVPGWIGSTQAANLAGKGVDTLFGIYSNRQQSKANREALAYQQSQNARAEAWDREQELQRRTEFMAQQAELKRQWEATQKFESDKWAATEEDRVHRRQLEDEREVRRAPFRAASAAALERLPGIMASGRTSPGLGSLGSYRR